MKRRMIQGLGLLTVSVAPLSMVVSCGKKKPTSNINVDPNSDLASLNKMMKKLSWLLKGLSKENKNTTDNLLIQDIENKLVFYLYEEEQKASAKFSKLRKEMHEKYSQVPTFDKLPTKATLEKDANNELKDAIEQVKNRFGIHQWEKAWTEQRRKNYGGALTDAQAIDFILRSKMASDAFGRFSLKIDSSTFVKEDFFKIGKGKKGEKDDKNPTLKNFKKDNEYGLKFEDVLVKPKVNLGNEWENDAAVYVYETKSYVKKARRGETLKKIFDKYNKVIVPIHYLLPVVPGKEATDAWTVTKKADLKSVVKKLLHTNGEKWPKNAKYSKSGFNAMMNFKGLIYKDGKFDVSSEDERALRDGPDGNASKKNGGALGMFGEMSLLSQMAPGYSISSLTSILDKKANIGTHIRINPSNPLENLQTKLWAALEELKKGAFPTQKTKDKFDGENFNKAIDKLVDKLDKEKFVESIGNVFKDAFGPTEGRRTLIYQDEKRSKNIAVSQFGIHIMSNLKKDVIGQGKTGIDFINSMIKDDLLQTSQSKAPRMNVESKISAFINQSKLGSVSLYMIINYLKDEDFIKYLLTQKYNTKLDENGIPLETPPNYTKTDIANALKFSKSIIDKSRNGLAQNMSEKIDKFVYGLLNRHMINSTKNEESKISGLWNSSAVTWLQKAIYEVEKGGE